MKIVLEKKGNNENVLEWNPFRKGTSFRHYWNAV